MTEYDPTARPGWAVDREAEEQEIEVTPEGFVLIETQAPDLAEELTIVDGEDDAA